jgi:hypothetical protein
MEKPELSFAFAFFTKASKGLFHHRHRPTKIEELFRGNESSA